jgi:hypothetical protein
MEEAMSGLPTDVIAARLTNGIYTYAGFARPEWDHLHLANDPRGVSYGLKKVDSTWYLVFRGSTTPWDWLHDFEAVANPFSHSVLGPVHPGFHEGLSDVWKNVRDIVGSDDVVVCGHSLGAGRACIMTGIMVAAAHAPVARVCFGEPRPGFKRLADLTSSVPATSYRNGNGIIHDMITDVPMALGPENYVHPCSLTDVCRDPTDTDFKGWGPFAWHGMPLYLDAIEKLNGLPSSWPKGVILNVGGPHKRAEIH